MSEFVLQDSRGNTGDRLMFWAKDGAGYTTNLENAQRYTKEQACSQNESRESDLPWPLAYLVERMELAVDCQYLEPEAVDAGMQTAERGYLYADKAWNGNDLYWLTNDGDVTSDFGRAHAFPVGIAASMAARKHHNVNLAPADLVESLARKVVPSGKVKHKEALRGTGIILAKPPRYRARSRSSIQNCGGCGRFVSSPMYADCSHCGADNAP